MRNIFLKKLSKFVFFLLFILFVLFFKPFIKNVFAIKSVKKTPIHITADKIVYNKKESVYIITGNVLIIRKGLRLKADKVVYYYKTDLAVATGHVIVHTKNSITRAKKLKIYLKNRLGTIYHSNINYTAKSIFVYGQKIKHKGKKFYQVKNGYLTSCSRKPPSWKLYSGFSDIYVGSYAYSYNSIFYIHNIPVLYIPFMVTPIKTKKSSGLLIPSAGYNKLTGYQASDGYYFDLGRSQDLTYYLDYYSYLGIGNALKYRYGLNQYSHGSIYVFYMREINSQRNFTLAPSLTRYLLFSHNMDFIYGLALKANINIPSDPAFYPDFSTNIYTITKNRLSSNFSVTKDWGSFSARMNFLRLDNLFFPNYATVQEYPRLSVNGQTDLDKIFNTHLYLKLHSSLSILRSPAYYNANRLDIFPKLYLPLKFISGVHITPAAGFRYTGYYDVQNGIGAPPAANGNREMYYASISTNAVLFKNYIVSKKNDTGYMSFIKPYVNYDLIKPVNQYSLPLFDQTDYIPSESAFKYGFNWSLENYSKKSLSNLLSFDMYQYHSVSGNFINPVNYLNYQDSNSDIITRLKFHPVGNLTFLGSGSYDTYSYVFRQYNLSALITDPRQDTFGIGYTGINDVQGYLSALNMFNSSNPAVFPQGLSLITPSNTLAYANLSVNLHIIDGFSINTVENYDITIHKDISNSIGFLYQSGCIGFVANYINLPYFHQWAFSFGIILKGIGTYGFGNMATPTPATAGGISLTAPNFNSSF